MTKSLVGPVVRFHVKLFYYLGYQTISLDTISQSNSTRFRRIILKIWILLLLTSFSILTLFTFLSDDEYLYKGDSFGYFNDCLKIGIAQLTLTVTYLETLFCGHKLTEFWQQYLNLHKQPATTTKLPIWKYELLVHFRFLAMFYGIIVAEASLQCIYYALRYYQISRHVLLFWFMFTPYIFSVRFRNLQCVFHMECMRLELQQLECELRVLAEYTNFARRIVVFDGFAEFIRCKLVQLQLNYERIHDMFSSFHKSFGFSLTLVLLMAYVRVLVDAYFIYYTMYRGWDPLEDILLIPALFEIPMLLITSKNCMNAVKYITLQLHNIKHSVDDVHLSRQIQNFSLQLLHQKIRIDAVGITVMDGYMLSRAIGSITTYMIFFIQFMPKFQKT